MSSAKRTNQVYLPLNDLFERLLASQDMDGELFGFLK